MRCFSSCSDLYAIYDIITVPSEGIFSLKERGNLIKVVSQFILYVVSFQSARVNELK